MALAGWERAAILDAVNWISEGKGLAVGTREFWKRYNFPFPDDRRDIARRAKGVIAASLEFTGRPTGATAADVAGDAGYPLDTGGGGPLDMPVATVFGKIDFYGEKDPDTGIRPFITSRTFSEDYPWGTTIEEIFLDLDDVIAAFEEQYELENGSINMDTVRFI